MLTPLYNAVADYCNQSFSRLHMPGHKGVEQGPLAGVLRLDITEVEGADSLFHAAGPIAALENELARLYGARRTLLSAGGATLCIQTMLALACGTGAKVIMSRNIHRSAINACALLDLTPVWIWPEADAGGWFSGRYTPQTVAVALDENPDAKAVYITSPDYFGVVSALAEIAAVCRARNVFLLVDNAHGAHLPFVPTTYRVPHPIHCGASACADSLHKTMPAMTGGALLHLGDARLCGTGKEMMSLFGSTSPSYPILLSCEQAGVYADSAAKDDFARVTTTLDRLRVLAREKGCALPEGAADPAKLSFAFAPLGVGAAAFGEYLRTHQIEPEYLSETACVLMANGLNAPEDFLRIERMLHELPWSPTTAPPPSLLLPHCEAVVRVREAVFAARCKIPLAQAVGRVAALEASPCPPGIPLVMSGERITPEVATLLAAFGLREIWAIDD